MIKNQDKKLQRGASLVEYALLIALVAIAALVAMQVLGQKVSQRFSGIASTVQ
jgi:Flp pilus assembly pilin Flp